MQLTKRDIQSDQWDAIDSLIDRDETLFIAPKGFGKCMVAYTAICEMLHAGVVNRVLVLSTANVCTDTWDKEPERWPHLKEFKALCLTKMGPEVRYEMLMSDAKIIICNFENLAWLVDNMPDRNMFDGLVVDEITKLKNVGGENYKKFRNRLATNNSPFKWRVGMTADAVIQEGIDIYGQMLIIDGGKTLGRNQDMFRRRYFMTTDFDGKKWVYQPTKQEQLAKDIAPVVYRVAPDAYRAALPDLKTINVKITMPEDVRQTYLTIARDGGVMVDDTLVEAPNAAAVKGKMLQLCNGAIYYDEQYSTVDEEGDPCFAYQKKTKVFNTDKVRTVKDIVNSLDSPALVIYQYEFQKKQLQVLTHAPVYAAKLSKARKTELIQEWNAGRIPILLAHPKSAGHGLNLQYGPCHTLINLCPYQSADEYDQTIGRLWRRGQKAKSVTVYNIICANTLEDTDVLPRLEDRIEIAKQFDAYLEVLANG